MFFSGAHNQPVTPVDYEDTAYQEQVSIEDSYYVIIALKEEFHIKTKQA